MNIQSKHKAVARYLALGFPLSDICDALGLNKATWARTVSEPIFREELSRIQMELEDRILDDGVKDPVYAALKIGAAKSVQTLLAEQANMNPEEGASASTRIKAANSILDRVGYNSAPQQAAVNITFQLSREKLELACGKPPSIEPQPDSIEG